MKESGSLVKIFYRSGITNTAWGPGICFHKKKSRAQTQKHPTLLHQYEQSQVSTRRLKYLLPRPLQKKKNLPIVALGQRQKGIKSKKIA